MLATMPKGDLLLRGDSVAFPPDGCASCTRHSGPGIRCLIDGGIRIDTPRPFDPLRAGQRVVRDRPPIRCSRRPRPTGQPLHPGHGPAARPARQKLVPVRQRGGQGEAARAAVQGVRRRADRAAERITGFARARGARLGLATTTTGWRERSLVKRRLEFQEENSEENQARQAGSQQDATPAAPSARQRR